MLLVFQVIVTFFLAFAQEESNEEAFSNAFSVTTGPILPSGISGVTEIQSSWGLRFAYISSPSSQYELGYTRSNSNGVLLQSAYLSMKSESSVEGMLVQMYLGAEYTMYEAETTTTIYDEQDVGGHIGSALLIPISRTSFFRSDMKLTMQPGTSLYIGFGFERRFGSSESEEE